MGKRQGEGMGRNWGATTQLASWHRAMGLLAHFGAPWGGRMALGGSLIQSCLGNQGVSKAPLEASFC